MGKTLEQTLYEELLKCILRIHLSKATEENPLPADVEKAQAKIQVSYVSLSENHEMKEFNAVVQMHHELQRENLDEEEEEQQEGDK